jgi:hypothetical protein
MHPFTSRAFKRHQEHYLKHPSLVDLITTKQNKLPSFIDRWQGRSETHPLLSGVRAVKKNANKKVLQSLLLQAAGCIVVPKPC